MATASKSQFQQDQHLRGLTRIRDLFNVSHIPLTSPPYGHYVGTLKGCEFNPPLHLSPHHLYLFAFTMNSVWRPLCKFYNIPEQGQRLAWIKAFHPIQTSLSNEAGYTCYAYEAIEGDPPRDVQAFYHPRARIFNQEPMT